MSAGQTRGVVPFIQKLGIVAGGGTLPALLIAHCRARDIPHYIIALKGQASPDLPRDAEYPMGRAGLMVAEFRAAGVRDLVLIGSVKRPRLFDMAPDFYTARFFTKLGLRALGDDGLLKAVRRQLEEEGFILHGFQDFLPQLLMPSGVIGSIMPDERQHADIALGIRTARELGARDEGQACVVMNGRVLGVEDAEGTNALIRRCAGERGAILVKMCKPQQDRKLDLPTIGVETVRLCAELKYAGIVAEAGQSFLIEADAVRRIADDAGLFVIGVSE